MPKKLKRPKKFNRNVTVKISERQKQILNIVKENPNILQTELANPPPTKKISIKRFYLLTIGIPEVIFSAQVYSLWCFLLVRQRS